jgi:hypothetical protein
LPTQATNDTDYEGWSNRNVETETTQKIKDESESERANKSKNEGSVINVLKELIGCQ